MGVDSFFNTINTEVGQVVGGMYYYFMNNHDMVGNSGVLGNCPAIHSVWWSPLIDETMLRVKEVDYDIERFGKIQGYSLNYTPVLKRIDLFRNAKRELKKLPVYKAHKKTHQYRDWRNESRLYNFPYSYGMLTDYMNPPMEIKYHECSNKKEMKICSRAFVSDKGTYSLFVEGLKGDYNGNLECAISSAPTDVPVGSSAYSQWSATQKAQDMHNTRQALMQSDANMLQAGVGGAMGVIGGLLNLQLGTALNSGVNAGFGMYNAYLQQQDAIGKRNAQQKDLSNTPRTMISTGSDVNFSMINGGRKIDLVRYTITEEFKERLGNFFAQYGYKQSKLMFINKRNRYYYNYIKTVGVNLQPVSEGIPKEHLEELKSIYDNGVTIWHMDRAGVNICDYTFDNYEV